MHHTHHYVNLSGTIKANCWSCYIAFMASDEEMAIKKPQMVFWRLEQQGSRIVYFQTLGECFHFSSLLNLWREQFITIQLFCIITSKLNKIIYHFGSKTDKNIWLLVFLYLFFGYQTEPTTFFAPPCWSISNQVSPHNSNIVVRKYQMSPMWTFHRKEMGNKSGGRSGLYLLHNLTIQQSGYDCWEANIENMKLFTEESNCTVYKAA